MKLLFITTNIGKFNQAKELFNQHGITLEHSTFDYPEHQELTIPEIAEQGARYCADKLQKPVMVDDTGIFFDAYPGFPGPLSKSIYKMLGFDGLFRLLDRKERSAYFMAACAYCEPQKEPKIFEGVMRGKIVEDQPPADKSSLPYEVIFIPEGKNKTLREFTPEERTTSLKHHRTTAFLKLIEYLKTIYRKS